MIAANLGKTPCTAAITLDLRRMGAVTRPKRVYDGVDGQTVPLADDKLELVFAPRDYRMIIIEGEE